MNEGLEQKRYGCRCALAQKGAREQLIVETYLQQALTNGAATRHTSHPRVLSLDGHEIDSTVRQ